MCPWKLNANTEIPFFQFKNKNFLCPSRSRSFACPECHTACQGSRPAGVPCAQGHVARRHDPLLPLSRRLTPPQRPPHTHSCIGRRSASGSQSHRGAWPLSGAIPPPTQHRVQHRTLIDGELVLLFFAFRRLPPNRGGGEGGALGSRTGLGFDVGSGRGCVGGRGQGRWFVPFLFQISKTEIHLPSPRNTTNLPMSPLKFSFSAPTDH